MSAVRIAVLSCVLVAPATSFAAEEGGYAPIEEDGGDGASAGGGRASDLMPPSTRPMFFVGAIGPTFFGLNRPDGSDGPGDPDFDDGFGRWGRAKLALEFGYHFSGDFEGPAIGAGIEQTFDDRFYVFHPSFKFWWDIQILDEYGIYVTPFGKAGYALTGACAGCPDHAANIGLGVEGRVVFEDRWIALLRPVHVDTYLGNFFGETFLLNYSVLIGGGVAF